MERSFFAPGHYFYFQYLWLYNIHCVLSRKWPLFYLFGGFCQIWVFFTRSFLWVLVGNSLVKVFYCPSVKINLRRLCRSYWSNISPLFFKTLCLLIWDTLSNPCCAFHSIICCFFFTVTYFVSWRERSFLEIFFATKSQTWSFLESAFKRWILITPVNSSEKNRSNCYYPHYYHR